MRGRLKYLRAACRCCSCWRIAGLASLLLAATICLAQAPPEAAKQLAVRIGAVLPQKPPVKLEFRNNSSLAQSEFLNLRQAIDRELNAAGIQTRQGDTDVSITLTENLTGFILTAQVKTTEGARVALASWPKAETGQVAGGPKMSIVLTPVRQQAEPILDFSVDVQNSRLTVLEPTQMVVYSGSAGQWQTTRTVPFTSARPMPRDPRGRLQTSGASFSAFLPGTVCSGSYEPNQEITCSPGDAPFRLSSLGEPVRWVAGRNLLQTPSAVSANAAFYSLAPVDEQLSLVAPINGPVRLVNLRSEQSAAASLATVREAGSDFATVDSACGSFIVASGAGDGPSDVVQAIERRNLRDQRVTVAGPPLSVPGRVTALWPGAIPTELSLVVRNEKTRSYEASRLSISCGE
jgi:hypothetical protein